MIEEFISLTNDLENRQDASSPTNTPPWKLLVVDDDPEVHSVTRFVLQNLHIFGRPVCLLHAHDGQQARMQLRMHPDIAVALVDVGGSACARTLPMPGMPSSAERVEERVWLSW